MAWFVLYRTDTGEMVSVGSVVADPLPAGLAALDVGADRPDMAALAWDPVTRTLVPCPPAPVAPDPLDDLAAALADAQTLEEQRDAWAAYLAAVGG